MWNILNYGPQLCFFSLTKRNQLYGSLMAAPTVYSPGEVWLQEIPEGRIPNCKRGKRVESTRGAK